MVFIRPALSLLEESDARVDEVLSRQVTYLLHESHALIVQILTYFEVVDALVNWTMHKGSAIVMFEESNIPVFPGEFDLEREALSLEVADRIIVCIGHHMEIIVVLSPHFHVTHEARAISSDLLIHSDGAEHYFDEGDVAFFAKALESDATNSLTILHTNNACMIEIQYQPCDVVSWHVWQLPRDDVFQIEEKL